MTIRAGAFFSMLLLLAPATISASQVTGPVQKLLVNGGGTIPITITVTVTGAVTACTASGSYMFEYADTGIGKVWTSLLLTAYSLGKDVTISGNGDCYGSFGGTLTSEGIQRIELR